MNSGDYKYIWQAATGRTGASTWQHWLAPWPRSVVPRAVDGASGRRGHGAARSGEPGGADRGRGQDQRDRGRAAQRRIRALVHRPQAGRGHRRAGPGGSPRRGRGRDGAGCHGQLPGRCHAGAAVRLACRAVSHRLLRPFQDQGRRLARRCQRPDAGGVRPHRPPARAFRGAARRPSGGRNQALPRLAEWRIKRAAAAQGRPGHLWFVTLHPFDDGNGRIARAIGDLLLARADGSPQRFYSLSAQIQRERKAYYDILERTQKRSMDVTEWLAWFLDTPASRRRSGAAHARCRAWPRHASGSAGRPRP
jgi:hypothetical protein